MRLLALVPLARDAVDDCPRINLDGGIAKYFNDATVVQKVTRAVRGPFQKTAIHHASPQRDMVNR